MDLLDRQYTVTTLKDALVKFDQGYSDEAVALVTSLKPGASKLLVEEESALEKLEMLEEFFSQQKQFLTHHVGTLERKEKELIISKTVSESIQRTQQKKLQACKWDLMKARNALYSTQKSLRRKEREQNIEAGYQCLILLGENGVDDLDQLRTTANSVQVEVNKRELECTNKESFLSNNRRRISEIREKVETLSKRTKSLQQLFRTCVTNVVRVREVREYHKKVISLWVLCKKVSGNGCSREDAMRAMSKQAKEQTKTLSSLLDAKETTEEANILSTYEHVTTNGGILDLLKFNFNCRHCRKAFTYLPENKHMKCKECSSIDQNEAVRQQKVIVEYYECVKDGAITGHIRVSNLAYDKQVFVHHSQNGWLSSLNTNAHYSSSCTETDCDHFQFQIPFDATLSSTLEFVVCYRVDGLEFWDNNGGQNYIVNL